VFCQVLGLIFVFFIKLEINRKQKTKAESRLFLFIRKQSVECFRENPMGFQICSQIIFCSCRNIENDILLFSQGYGS